MHQEERENGPGSPDQDNGGSTSGLPDRPADIRAGSVEETTRRTQETEVDLGEGRDNEGADIEDGDFLLDLHGLLDTPMPPCRYEERLRSLDPETVREIDAELREPLPESLREAIIAEAERRLGLQAAWTEARKCWHLWGFAGQDEMRTACRTLASLRGGSTGRYTSSIASRGCTLPTSRGDWAARRKGRSCRLRRGPRLR